jgi:hypothetical protein
MKVHGLWPGGAPLWEPGFSLLALSCNIVKRLSPFYNLLVTLELTIFYVILFFGPIKFYNGVYKLRTDFNRPSLERSHIVPVCFVQVHTVPAEIVPIYFIPNTNGLILRCPILCMSHVFTID